MTASEDWERGLRRLVDLDPAGAAQFVESLEGVSPELARLVVEVAFGRVHVREQLDPKVRELLTVASLAVLGGCEAQLRFHVGAALNVGVQPAEVVESLVHIVMYAGLPRALTALSVVEEVFAERQVEHAPRD